MCAVPEFVTTYKTPVLFVIILTFDVFSFLLLVETAPRIKEKD